MQATVAGAGAVENRALGVFQSPNQLGSFSGLLLFVGLGLALGARTRLERVVGGLCAAAAAAALLITLSRGAWIGAAVALVVLLAMSRRARRAVPVVIGAAVVIVPIALTVAAPQLLEVLVDRAAALVELDANPEDARPLIYQEAVRQIVERPWTGQGPANYAIVLESAESSAPGVDVVHAHNVLLQVAAETGIPSAVLLVAFTLSMARQVLQARSRLQAPEQDVLAGLACGLVVLVGQGFADFTLGNPTLLFLAWTVVGFLFAATTLPGPGEPDPAPSSGDGRLEVGRTVVGVRPAEPAPV
jgi:O-antigen ligase